MAKASKLVKRLMRGLQANGSAVETGPGLDEFLRAAAAKVASGPRRLPARLAIRSRGEKTTLYIVDGKTRKSTGVSLGEGVDPTVAKLTAFNALENYNDKRTSTLLREISHEDVTVAQILQEWLEDREKIASEPVFGQHVRYVQHLTGHFTDTRLGDLKYNAGLEYVTKRTEEAVKAQAANRKGRKYKISQVYAVGHLKLLRRAIESYCRKHALPVVYHFEIPKSSSTKTKKWLTWDQLIRLLLAARCWKFDVEGNCWKTKTIIDANGREVTVLDMVTGAEAEELRIVERYILIYFYSGTRNGCIPPLRWGVDLDGGSIDAAAGVIYRAGIGQDANHKRKEPSYLLGSLKSLVVEWEREDRRKGFEYVIHDPAGNNLENVRRLFNIVKQNAGLEWVTPHVLKHTGATLLTHAGLEINVLARAFSTTPQTLMDAYTHLHWKWLGAKATKYEDSDLDLWSLKHTSPRSISAWRQAAARTAKA